LAVLQKTPPMLIEAIDPCARLAEAYVRLWQHAKASGHGEAQELARSAEKVCAFARRLSKRFPIMAPDALHWRAESDLLLGRRATAIRGWEASLAAAERCHMPYHAWRAHQTLAERHDDPARAASHRANADALRPAVFDPRRTTDVS
jgi:hypothetical protein